MQIGILNTSVGSHPADKWAAVSAAQIAGLIEIDEKSTSEAAAIARKAKPRFELALAEALEGHHKTVQDHELSKLEEHGAARYDHSLDPADHVPETIDEAMAAVAEAAKGSPFEAHFALAPVQDVVRRTLASHFSSVMHIERSWHKDRGGKAAA